MTKTITNIVQNDSGGTNPDTHAHEDKVWELQFEDENSAVMTKGKMLEYLTKGTVPVKTVHSFKKWDIITKLGHTIRTWVVVYDDKSHVQLANKDFYSLLTHGHTTVNGEEVTETIEGGRGAVSDAIAQVVKKSVTTLDEKVELDEFRQDAMRDNYSPVFGKKEEASIEE
jgi:hypothetical protein